MSSQVLHELLNMAIFDDPEGFLQGFQLFTVHLYLFYLENIAVKLAQSDFLSSGHLNVATRWFVVHVRN